ncbi:MAG TPA: peptide-methionine (S)-S-oxide reductase MsrA [Candidatus Anoxymicrobiaceae bacterium]|jgi:peptide-methionine (S)-S-oxide reductase
MTDKLERIVLGGGCFWCVEAALIQVPGVEEVTPGYAGGTTRNPSYKEVCGGLTGHAEVARIEYDPGVVSLEEVLGYFFAMHDPTTPNRQGHDVGTQYRSIVLYDSKEQKERVEGLIESIAGDFSRPIITQVEPLEEFYPAEDYHHQYFEKNPRQAYCLAVVAPKVEKIRKKLTVK